MIPPAPNGPDDRLADYPPPYPTGWYRVANSAELEPGGVLKVQCLGRSFTVFRGRESGRASVLDSHCPHQGADLSRGDVKGDHLRCPFHHWEFGCKGAVKHVPAVDKLPRAQVQSFPTREVDGMVWMFWDAAAPPGSEAPYEPEVHDDVSRGELVYRGEHDHGDVGMHLVEFAENSVDFGHFQPVHGQMLIPWTRIQVPFINVRHQAAWWVDPDRPWVSFFKNEPHLEVRGKAIPRSGITAMITLFGPGGVVYFRFSLPELGDILLYHTHTPVGPMRQRVYFRWFADKKIPRALVHYVVGSWIGQWRADIDIWENKVYRERPMLTAADGPVHQMRRWYRQFFDPSRSTSPTTA